MNIFNLQVSSTSPHNSNGSSTSTKQVAVEETKEVVVEESEAAVSEDDLLALAQKAAEAEAAEKEASKESVEELEKQEEQCEEEKMEEEEQSKTSEATEKEAEETATAAEDTSVDDDDDMASKLAASGISVSLIKKKKALVKEGSTVGESAKEKSSTGEEKQDGTAVEIGPNISVTMIHKEKNTEKKTAARSPGLSIKSPGELLETPRRVSAQLEDLKDSISVSRVHRSPAASTPSTPRLPNLAPHQTTADGPQQMFPNQFGPQGARALTPGMPMGPPGGHGPMGMPGLHPRPGGPGVRAPAPLTSGPVSEQLAVAASGLADYMRMGLEELLREMSAQGSPQATIKGLQLEIEKMAWRHQQEMAEMKQNVDIMMKDMKSNLEKENQRIVEQYKAAAKVEMQKAIEETKKKQWCANCTKEGETLRAKVN